LHRVLRSQDTVVTIDATGKITKRQRHHNELRVANLGWGVRLDLMRIPVGTFSMGSPAEEEGRKSDEGPQHSVTVPAFWMGKYPVTQAQWRAVAALPKIDRDLGVGADPSLYKGNNRPVEGVSWEDAVEFCKRLSTYTGCVYRLPSEAEWEYACRAGTTTPFHFGETITTDLANYYSGWDRHGTTNVGSFNVTNAFGLYDMHGNVWEWCLDYWHESYEGAPTNGSAWTTGGDSSFRVLRGGAWGYNPDACRSANRGRATPDTQGRGYGVNGFRVVCVSS
jgi:formylglycine-generating enzyme required for sulfatase activity